MPAIRITRLAANVTATTVARPYFRAADIFDGRRIGDACSALGAVLAHRVWVVSGPSPDVLAVPLGVERTESGMSSPLLVRVGLAPCPTAGTGLVRVLQSVATAILDSVCAVSRAPFAVTLAHGVDVLSVVPSTLRVEPVRVGFLPITGASAVFVGVLRRVPSHVFANTLATLALQSIALCSVAIECVKGFGLAALRARLGAIIRGKHRNSYSGGPLGVSRAARGILYAPNYSMLGVS